jgi:hypothetical protein
LRATPTQAPANTHSKNFTYLVCRWTVISLADRLVLVIQQISKPESASTPGTNTTFFRNSNFWPIFSVAVSGHNPNITLVDFNSTKSVFFLLSFHLWTLIDPVHRTLFDVCNM